MTGYLVRRLIQVVITFLAFLTLVFFLIQAQPGDFASFYALNPRITPEGREAIAKAFGLNDPVWLQYFRYMGNFFMGDLGTSFSHYPRSVWNILVERAPRTVILFVTATVVSFYFGFVLGKLIAWYRGRTLEYISTIGGVYLYTVFTPWFGLLMIWLFAFKAGWFPMGKFLNPELWRSATVDANFVFHRIILTAAAISAIALIAAVVGQRLRWRAITPVVICTLVVGIGMTVLGWGLSPYWTLAWDIIKHMVLPVLVLSLISFAGTMLLMRNSMLETMREDYVLTARAKGLSESAVRDRHAARNALLPVVTSFVFSLAFAIDGGVITETIFSWPGMGLTLLDAAVSQDLPLAVGAFVLTGVFALIAHVIADVLYAFLDPRIRYQ
jgi:peptide/nickel transport system permease protein